jgi:guanine deaminase
MTPQTDREKWMREAIGLSEEAIISNRGAPFGAVIVRGGQLIGSGQNIAPSTHDPTAHAEVVAIRDACRRAGSMDLRGSELYSSCEPCPMCLGAVYWAKIDRVYFAISCAEAAEYGFDDQFLYREMAKPHAERMVPMSRIVDAEALKVFRAWSQRTDKLGY